MITAILEILFLLSVSCLIGIFFTYRYWKEKINGYKDQLIQTQDMLKIAKEESSGLKGLKDENEELKKNIKISLEETEIQKATLTEAKNALKAEKEKVAGLKADLKKSKESLKSQKAKAIEKKPASTPKADPEVKLLKEALELKEIEFGEMERELEEISAELRRGKISYYKQIDGKRYKALTLTLADESVEGKGDGRISKEDAEKIFATISDGTAYTQVEKHTLRYIRENYNWTEGADELFRKKVRSWAAKGHHLS